MGRFAIVLPDDPIESCISAARTNIRMFEEDIERGYTNSEYLLDFAIGALEQAKTKLQSLKGT